MSEDFREGGSTSIGESSYEHWDEGDINRMVGRDSFSIAMRWAFVLCGVQGIFWLMLVGAYFLFAALASVTGGVAHCTAQLASPLLSCTVGRG